MHKEKAIEFMGHINRRDRLKKLAISGKITCKKSGGV